MDKQKQETSPEAVVMFHGCMAFISWIMAVLIFSLICPFLSSCAGSQSYVCGITDSLSISADSNVFALQSLRSDSIYEVKSDSVYTSVAFSESEDDRETIVEHIVESFDSVGNRMVVTDRTINRNSSYSKNYAQDEWESRREERLQELNEKIESAWSQYRLQKEETHEVYTVKDKKTEPAVSSAWHSVKGFLGILMIIVSVVYPIYYFWANGKEKGRD